MSWLHWDYNFILKYRHVRLGAYLIAKTGRLYYFQSPNKHTSLLLKSVKFTLEISNAIGSRNQTILKLTVSNKFCGINYKLFKDRN